MAQILHNRTKPVGRRQTSRDGYQKALQRLQAKQHIIHELISGKLELLEATARFRQHQAEATSGGEEGESLCRVVIGWVHLALSDRPERAEAFSEQLERELQSHLARHGSIQLPLAS
jgi:hypothetical protein